MAAVGRGVTGEPPQVTTIQDAENDPFRLVKIGKTSALVCARL